MTLADGEEASPALRPEAADVYFGHGQTILLEREKAKRRTIEQRRLGKCQSAA